MLATAPSPVTPGSNALLEQPDQLNALAAWLHSRDLLPHGSSLRSLRMAGGQSNPSWQLQAPDRAWVLRAKPAPAAQLLPSAHAIEREFRILQALQGTPVPVPRVLAMCEDESVIGVSFYLMEFVNGRVFSDPSLPALPVTERRAYYEAAARVLSALHRVDWRSLGLQDFGRQEGYYSRLIRRWSKQYRATCTDPVPAMEWLMHWLPDHIPPGADDSADTCITHGDYRMENLMFHPERPEVVAVLDWELATLGHPMGDLAYNALAWHLPAGLLRGLADLNLVALGLPSEKNYLAAYAHFSRQSLSELANDWPFYLAFNLFRLSAILQGIGHRASAGRAANATAEQIAAFAPSVAAWGMAIAQGRQPNFYSQ